MDLESILTPLSGCKPAARVKCYKQKESQQLLEIQQKVNINQRSSQWIMESFYHVCIWMWLTERGRAQCGTRFQDCMFK